MRVRRLLATFLATAVAAPVAATLGAAPAQAATPTQIVGGSDGSSWISRGDYAEQPGVIAHGGSLRLNINVQDSSGQQVYEGTVSVRRKLAGEKSWRTIAQSDGAYLYDTIKAAGNATYQVLYSGSATYDPSSAAASVKVQRKLNDDGVKKRRGLFLVGKVQPTYKKKTVVIQRKVGKAWKVYKKVRTNAKSRFSAKVAAPAKVGGKIPYRIYIPAGGGYSASQSHTYTATKTYYRAATVR